MRQRTPGPWRIAKGTMDFGAIVSDTCPRPTTIGQGQVDETAAYGGYIIAESIAKQDRPLIAMAPDLLAACEDARQCLSIYWKLQGEYAREQVLQAVIGRIAFALEDFYQLEREIME